MNSLDGLPERVNDLCADAGTLPALATALIALIEHFERVDAPARDKAAIEEAKKIYADHQYRLHVRDAHREPGREKQIAAMSVELEKHDAFREDPVKAIVWATRAYEAALDVDPLPSALPDLDDLATAIWDTIGPEWSPYDAARAVLQLMQDASEAKATGATQ